MTPEPPDCMQPLIERFIRARWVTGLCIDHPQYFQVEFTEAGRKRMLQLAAIVHPVTDYLIVGSQRPSVWSQIKVVFFFIPFAFLAWRLGGGFSKREVEKLIMFAGFYRLSGEGLKLRVKK